MVTAKLRYLRIAPRKVRLAADLIRGKSVEEAEELLLFTVKRVSLPMLKLLKSAVANAKNNFQLDESNLYIQKILVDEGPKYKRWMPQARGQAYEIQKKTSHITIVLEETAKKAKRNAKRKKVESVEKKAGSAESEKPSAITGPKFRPEKEKRMPKIEKGFKRIFKRKAF